MARSIESCPVASTLHQRFWGGALAKLKPEQIEKFYAALAKANPDPRGELEYINPYTLLVAVVLCAQATDVSVNKATEPLFKMVDTPEKMLALGEARLKDYIKTIGLYSIKAKNVIALSRILIEQLDGKVPQRPRHAADAARRGPQDRQRGAQHRVRPAHHRGRHAHLPGREPHWPRARQGRGWRSSNSSRSATPEKYKRNAHHWLILHGRYICKARKPECPRCVVSEICAFPANTTICTLPAKKTEPKVDTAGKRARR